MRGEEGGVKREGRGIRNTYLPGQLRESADLHPHLSLCSHQSNMSAEREGEGRVREEGE